MQIVYNNILIPLSSRTQSCFSRYNIICEYANACIIRDMAKHISSKHIVK